MDGARASSSGRGVWRLTRCEGCWMVETSVEGAMTSAETPRCIARAANAEAAPGQNRHSAPHEDYVPSARRGDDAARACGGRHSPQIPPLSATVGFTCFRAGPADPWPTLSALRRRHGAPHSAVPRQQRGSAQDTLIIPTALGIALPRRPFRPPLRSPNERAESPNPSTPPMLSRRETKRARRPRRPKMATARPPQTRKQPCKVRTIFFNPRFNPKPKSGPVRSMRKRSGLLSSRIWHHTCGSPQETRRKS